jgi:hypothetical protein
MASLLSAQPQTFYLEEWHASDGSQDETPDRVVSVYDFIGHTYVAGSTLNQYGRKDLLLTKFNSSGGEVWSEVFNLTDSTANVIVGNIILMPGPALVVTGSVYNGPANNYDALTVRFDTSGNYEWHQLFNGTASYYDGGADLFFDQNNRIYITGGTTNSGTLMDFLTICYDASGNQQWVQTYDGFGLFDAAAYIDHRIVPHITVVGAVQMDDTTWTAATVKYTTAGTQYGSAAFGDEVTLDEVKDIATDDDGNIYITGYNSDDGTGRDIITLKLDEELELQWTARYDGAAHLDDEGHGVAVDASGNVYVAGHTGTASQGKDYTVLKYNVGGTLQWSKHYNGAAGMDDAARDIAVDDAGQVYVTGYCTENHTRDYFTRILSQSNGDEVWSARFNGLYNKDDEAHRLLLDPAGNITLTGKTGMPDDKTTYTTVRYVKRSILLPPDEEAASNAINYIENKGQLLRTDGEEAADIHFYCAGQYPALYFRHDGLSLVLAHIDTSAATQDTMHRVDIAFHKSKGDERIYALEERPEFYNYYLGHIPEGRERVRLHDRLVHTDAFSGIDVQYYSNGGGVKYYIVCQPGADLDDIALVFSGHESLSTDGAGNLVIGTSLEEIVLPRPEAFQVDGSGNESSVGWTPGYSVEGDTVRLTYGSINQSLYLVFRIKSIAASSILAVDWVTYFGGSGFDACLDLALDGSDNFFLTGLTNSPVFPEGEGDITIDGTNDAFIVKISNADQVEWRTVLGGNGNDNGVGVDVFAGDEKVVIAGRTNSSDFPQAGDPPLPINIQNGFISIIEAGTGNLALSRYLGGNGFDEVSGVAVNSFNYIYVVGLTTSTNLDPIQESSTSYKQEYVYDFDGFIIKFNSILIPVWISYFGGFNFDAITDIAINHSNDQVFIVGETRTDEASSQDSNNPVCGEPLDGSFPDCDPDGEGGTYHQYWGGGNPTEVGDAFIAEFDQLGKLEWSTYLGGNGDETSEVSINRTSIAIAPNSSNTIAITGVTTDNGTFPHVNVLGGYSQNAGIGQYVVKFVDKEIEWSSGFGCLNIEVGGTSVTFDENENLYLSGLTECSTPSSENDYCDVPGSETFPICIPSSTIFFQNGGTPEFGGGSYDSFLAGFSNTNQLIWSTYFGGNGGDDIISLKYSESAKNLYFTGVTSSESAFPLRDPTNQDNYQDWDFNGGFGDGFIARLNIHYLVVQNSELFFNKKPIQVFPNPSSGHFEIILPEKPLRWEVFSLNGAILRNNTLEGKLESFQIDLTGFPAGIYFLKIAAAGGIYYSKLIIK